MNLLKLKFKKIIKDIQEKYSKNLGKKRDLIDISKDILDYSLQVFYFSISVFRFLN
jgi:hypothetical protein